MNKHIGWRESLLRSTSATKNMPIGLNCLADLLAKKERAPVSHRVWGRPPRTALQELPGPKLHSY
jgi:hypothetical protein